VQIGHHSQAPEGIEDHEDSHGEISGIAEFSTAMTVLLLANGTNWNFSYADRNRLLLML